jgi:hypothetical protein
MARTRIIDGPPEGKLEERVQRLLQATAGEDPAVRAALLRAIMARDTMTDTLWFWVVAGLLLLATIALGGLLYLLAQGNPNTPPELALTAFMGLLGGLLGMLIGAPWRGRQGTE